MKFVEVKSCAKLGIVSCGEETRENYPVHGLRSIIVFVSKVFDVFNSVYDLISFIVSTDLWFLRS